MHHFIKFSYESNYECWNVFMNNYWVLMLPFQTWKGSTEGKRSVYVYKLCFHVSEIDIYEVNICFESKLCNADADAVHFLCVYTFRNLSYITVWSPANEDLGLCSYYQMATLAAIFEQPKLCNSHMFSFLLSLVQWWITKYLHSM